VHHKLCHVLGGSLDLPHADTHAILLPHTVAYVADAARNQLAPAVEIFGEPIGGGLWDFASSIGAPLRLADLGVTEADLEKVADMALAAPYWSPRPLDHDGVRVLLHAAWAGKRPA